MLSRFFVEKIMKQAKTIKEQLEILMSRGLIINDYEKAYKTLMDVNYYTLTGYLFQFAEPIKLSTVNLNRTCYKPLSLW